MIFNILKNKEPPLTGEEMLELEEILQDIKRRQRFSRLKPYELADKLKLKVEHVRKNDMQKKVEASLGPIEDKRYNGVIRINIDSKNSDFNYIHEIMHYIMDVGVGNKVNKVYTRKKCGHTDCFHEQVINYMAAAYCMPRDEIEKTVDTIDDSWIDINFAKYIRKLGEKYHQTDDAVARRIQEIRKIRWFEEHSQST